MTLIATTSLVGWAGATVYPATAQAVTDDPNGLNLTVNVLGPASSGAGATSAIPPLMLLPADRPAAVPGVTQTTLRDPAVVAAALGAHPANIHDFLHVSGLTARTDPKVGPGGADLSLEFTMKNVSTAPITSSLRFWLDNAINLPVKTLDKVEVANLAPGETRTVKATLTDVSQWTFFRGHVTMTPPADIAGTALGPLTRDSFTLILPLFLLAAILLLGALYLAARYLLRLRRLNRPLPELSPGHGQVVS